ncbi:MAG: PaaI family thioesterase [Chloroflexota bacterium]
MSENRQHQFSVAFDDPLAGIQKGLSMSGLDYIRAMQAGEIVVPIALLMGMSVAEVEAGRVVFSGRPGLHHYNPLGTVHGGFYATLLDSAMGCAIHTTLPQGTGYTTLQLNVHFLRPITAEMDIVYCEGTVVHSGRRQATAEGRLIDASGKVYGHGTTTCAILK